VTVHVEKKAFRLQGNSFTRSRAVFKRLKPAAAKGQPSGEGKTLHHGGVCPPVIFFLIHKFNILKIFEVHGTLIAKSYGRTEKDGVKAVLL
jgi:hypothetical protein